MSKSSPPAGPKDREQEIPDEYGAPLNPYAPGVETSDKPERDIVDDTAAQTEAALSRESVELVRGAKVIVLFKLVEDKKNPGNKMLAGTTIDGYPRTKISFVEKSSRGQLPKEGEKWVCEIVSDTQPNELRKGAFIVRPLHKPRIVDENKELLVIKKRFEDRPFDKKFVEDFGKPQSLSVQTGSSYIMAVYPSGEKKLSFEELDEQYPFKPTNNWHSGDYTIDAEFTLQPEFDFSIWRPVANFGQDTPRLVHPYCNDKLFERLNEDIQRKVLHELHQKLKVPEEAARITMNNYLKLKDNFAVKRAAALAFKSPGGFHRFNRSITFDDCSWWVASPRLEPRSKFSPHAEDLKPPQGYEEPDHDGFYVGTSIPLYRIVNGKEMIISTPTTEEMVAIWNEAAKKNEEKFAQMKNFDDMTLTPPDEKILGSSTEVWLQKANACLATLKEQTRKVWQEEEAKRMSILSNEWQTYQRLLARFFKLKDVELTEAIAEAQKVDNGRLYEAYRLEYESEVSKWLFDHTELSPLFPDERPEVIQSYVNQLTSYIAGLKAATNEYLENHPQGIVSVLEDKPVELYTDGGDGDYGVWNDTMGWLSICSVTEDEAWQRAGVVARTDAYRILKMDTDQKLAAKRALLVKRKNMEEALHRKTVELERLANRTRVELGTPIPPAETMSDEIVITLRGEPIATVRFSTGFGPRTMNIHDSQTVLQERAGQLDRVEIHDILHGFNIWTMSNHYTANDAWWREGLKGPQPQKTLQDDVQDAFASIPIMINRANTDYQLKKIQAGFREHDSRLISSPVQVPDRVWDILANTVDSWDESWAVSASGPIQHEGTRRRVIENIAEILDLQISDLKLLRWHENGPLLRVNGGVISDGSFLAAEDLKLVHISDQTFFLHNREGRPPYIHLDAKKISDRNFWINFPTRKITMQDGSEVSLVISVNGEELESNDTGEIRTFLIKQLNEEIWQHCVLPDVRIPDERTFPHMMTHVYGRCALRDTPLTAYGVPACDPENPEGFIGLWFNEISEAQEAYDNAKLRFISLRSQREAETVQKEAERANLIELSKSEIREAKEFPVQPARWYLSGVEAEKVQKKFGRKPGEGFGVKVVIEGEHLYLPGSRAIVGIAFQAGYAKRYLMNIHTDGLLPLEDSFPKVICGRDRDEDLLGIVENPNWRVTSVDSEHGTAYKYNLWNTKGNASIIFHPDGAYRYEASDWEGIDGNGPTIEEVSSAHSLTLPKGMYVANKKKEPDFTLRGITPPTTLEPIGLDSVSFKESIGRYFQCSDCGYMNRMGSADYKSKYLKGEPVEITCSGSCHKKGTVQK